MSKIKSDLTVSGNVTINGTPTSANHAATKDYVDSAVPPNDLPAGGTTGQLLSKTSNTDYSVEWTNPPTNIWTPDQPPAVPTAYDYEFTGSGTTIPAGWSWTNQGTSTYLEKNGSGYLTAPTGLGWNNRFIHSPIATDASFEYRAKFRLVAVRNANYFQIGFFLTDGTKLIVAGLDSRGLKYIYWNTPTSYNTESGGYPLMVADTLYLALRKNSATSWDLGYSTDGEIYSWGYEAVNFSTFMTPTGIGFGFQNENQAGLQTVACDWFRKVA
jgi:hypothetical protein